MAEAVVPDSHRDLLEANYGVLATLAPDGIPQLTLVGFFFDHRDQRVKLSVNDARYKMKNLRRDPRSTLMLVDPENPRRSLEIRGIAELAPDVDYAFAAICGAKYHTDLRALDEPGETRSVVTLLPSRIVATHIG